jgi:outer membrane protein assembly factor BamC
MRTTSIRLAVVAASTLALSACSVVQGEKIDYKSTKTGNALEIPPDLTRTNSSGRFQVPTLGTANASDYAQAAPVSGEPNAAQVVVDQVKNMRIERQGSERWLVIDAAPAQLWDNLRGFWQDNGFFIDVDTPELGVMETDWAENRAKLPQDFIRESLGKLFDSLYSTGEMDKFRTRVERNKQGQTEITITHRGMQEVYNSNDKTSTVWQPRANDPGLESEFLRRLMLRLGASGEQANSAVAQSTQVTAYARETAGGVVLQDSAERAWRRVGLALDRTGFTVVSRDAATGTYTVRYARNQSPNAEQPGFFARLFGSKAANAQTSDLLVQVRGNAQTAGMTIQGNDPQAVKEAQALLLQDLQ